MLSNQNGIDLRGTKALISQLLPSRFLANSMQEMTNCSNKKWSIHIIGYFSVWTSFHGSLSLFSHNKKVQHVFCWLPQGFFKGQHSQVTSHWKLLEELTASSSESISEICCVSAPLGPRPSKICYKMLWHAITRLYYYIILYYITWPYIIACYSRRTHAIYMIFLKDFLWPDSIQELVQETGFCWWMALLWSGDLVAGTRFQYCGATNSYLTVSVETLGLNRKWLWRFPFRCILKSKSYTKPLKQPNYHTSWLYFGTKLTPRAILPIRFTSWTSQFEMKNTTMKTAAKVLKGPLLPCRPNTSGLTGPSATSGWSTATRDMFRVRCLGQDGRWTTGVQPNKNRQQMTN